MIIVDTNVIAYLLIVGDNTPFAKALLKKDPTWVAPMLWRSEFRNVVATYYRNNHIDLSQALFLLDRAEELMHNNEYQVNSRNVMQNMAESGCSAYDCEFIALAQDLNIKLVTTDKKLINAFPQITLHLKDI